MKKPMIALLILMGLSSTVTLPLSMKDLKRYARCVNPKTRMQCTDKERREVNQILIYGSITVVMAILTFAGAVFGGKKAIKQWRESQQKRSEAQQQFAYVGEEVKSLKETVQKLPTLEEQTSGVHEKTSVLQKQLEETARIGRQKQFEGGPTTFKTRAFGGGK